MAVTLFQTGVGTDPQLAVNNTTGKYSYLKRDGVTMMVTRNVLFLCSDIFDSDTKVCMELPAHPAFYCVCVGPDSTEHVLVAKDANLLVTVKKDYQIQAQVAL